MWLHAKQFRQAFLVGFLSLALYLSGVFIFWTPLPLFYLSFQRNRGVWQSSLMVLLGLALLFYFLILPRFLSGEAIPGVRFFGLSYLIFYLFLSAILSLGVWRGWSLLRWGLTGGLVVTVFVLLGAFLCQVSGFFDILGVWQQVLAESTRALEQISTTENMARRTEALAVLAQFKSWMPLFVKLIPAFLFVFTLVVMVINMWGLKLFFRSRFSLDWAGDFRKIVLSSFYLWILIALGFFYFLNVYFIQEEWLKILVLNGLIPIGFLYFLQGMSILVFYAQRFSRLFRIAIYAFVFLVFQPLGFLLVGVGIADIWFDFRRLNQREGSDAGHSKREY